MFSSDLLFVTRVGNLAVLDGIIEPKTAGGDRIYGYGKSEQWSKSHKKIEDRTPS